MNCTLTLQEQINVVMDHFKQIRATIKKTKNTHPCNDKVSRKSRQLSNRSGKAVIALKANFNVLKFKQTRSWWSLGRGISDICETKERLPRVTKLKIFLLFINISRFKHTKGIACFNHHKYRIQFLTLQRKTFDKLTCTNTPKSFLPSWIYNWIVR